MTSNRYFFCLIAKTFGYRRKNVYMTEAAGETHLLKEAEYHLGMAIWQKAENIEAVSVEYWNLRKLVKERERLSTELEACRKQLANAHEERTDLIGINKEPYQDLVNQRLVTLKYLEELASERDLIVTKAREIRRAYDGVKAKEEVLIKEGTHSPEEFAAISRRLLQLKAEFSELKTQRHELGVKIARSDAKIEEIESEIQRRKKEHRQITSEAFQFIGDTNQEMSSLRAELGALDARMHQLYTEIGKHVSRSIAEDPECRKACKDHWGLVDVMESLRKSILLNHKLADFV